MFIPYKQADGTTILAEVTDEVGAFILENDREMAKRRPSRLCPGAESRY